MVWLSLIPVAVLMCAGAWLSFTPMKQAWWFPYVMSVIAGLNGFLWAMCARAADIRTIYSLSIIYDSITILAYSVLPLIVFNIRLSATSMFGVALVILGACFVKWGE